LGLVAIVRTTPSVQCIVKMAMVLPLLPEHEFVNGVMVIETEATSFEVIQLALPLLQYIRNYWVNVVTPARVSVFGQHRRTNNNVESFNNVFGRRLGRHPNVWFFVCKYMYM
jgi:hypothetical protein